MKISTQFVYPPIPVRDFDWSAIDDDTYDGAEDAGPQCIGYGRTEEEAIADLLEQIGWGDQGIPDPDLRAADQLNAVMTAAGAIG